MIFAVLTALLFALSAIFGTRLTSLMDTISANFWRLLLAAVLLGVLALTLEPGSLQPRPFAWLFLSGFIGFGIGDIALFLAYPRIGSRLTILINFCLATVIGATADWLWLGDQLGLREWAAILVVLGGLALALLAARRQGGRRGSFSAGIWAAIVAGLGQGFGATISRHAESIAAQDGVEISGMSAAFQRVLAGLSCVAIVYLWKRARRSLRKPEVGAARIAPWILGAALAGPVIGVSCFQQALKVMGNSGAVMAVVATSPLILIPLAFIFEGDRPTRASVIGALIGVAGVISLALLRGG